MRGFTRRYLDAACFSSPPADAGCGNTCRTSTCFDANKGLISYFACFSDTFLQSQQTITIGCDAIRRATLRKITIFLLLPPTNFSLKKFPPDITEIHASLVSMNDTRYATTSRLRSWEASPSIASIVTVFFAAHFFGRYAAIISFQARFSEISGIHALCSALHTRKDVPVSNIFGFHLLLLNFCILRARAGAYCGRITPYFAASRALSCHTMICASVA